MDSRNADLLKDIDPLELGQRIRALRVAKAWTQTDLAGGDISVGYVSRIESGQRRPNAAVLEDLASRLGVPADHLLRGVSAREFDEIKLTLDFAELSLESGESIEAEVQAREALERARRTSQDELAFRARFLVARALEGQGNLDDAIIELEPLVAGKTGGVLRIKSAIALCRCFRESGDLNKAIEVGERVLDQLAGTLLDASDEAVQMAVTLAAAYYERGDAGQAVRTCRKAVTKAETLTSPTARASAYWNASIMEAEQGSVSDAVPLAERALALLSEGQDSRNLARLRTQLGMMQLRLDPPDVSEAQHNLEQAAQELEWSSAGSVDKARNELALARAHFFEGNIEKACEMSAFVHLTVREQAPIIAADAKTLEGQAAAQDGRADEAGAAYREAVLILTGIGADRGAAQLWFELAGLLEDIGDFDASRDAYRSAAASAGLRTRPSIRVRSDAR
ncbi:helix-turn-helix domain-containing protein [Nocardioides cynanchi]|uniref:helix-turn-helix domain-containing protein n=1 Tax=Nocardioides cynanchi TaxID=2558918 RepID=UPI0012454C42|nr:helix-turn-helix domain-containing protein [Nocardioides cynanchi]